MHTTQQHKSVDYLVKLNMLHVSNSAILFLHIAFYDIRRWPVQGVGAKHMGIHAPAVTRHIPPPKAKKQAHASGGIHATEAQAPPVATSGAQKPAAVVTHAVHVAGPASALGSL
jgi:hypothetical protein